MGTTLKLVVAAVAVLMVLGCGRMSAETVRDKDQQRIETSKRMPGNEIPMDPADGR